MATFLLIHGAGHDGWCWDVVSTHLRAAGHTAIAPDLPCDDLGAGLEQYADTAEAALPAKVDDLVVVGHSLGALTASLVAVRRPVRRLVFVAGIVGAPGRSLEDLAEVDADRDGALTPGVDFESDPEGRFRFTEAGARRSLYEDCSEETIQAALPHLRFQRSMWTERASFDAWPDVEVASILCRDDQIVNAAWARRIAKERLGVTAIELDGGHSPMLARPQELSDVLMSGLT